MVCTICMWGPLITWLSYLPTANQANLPCYITYAPHNQTHNIIPQIDSLTPKLQHTIYTHSTISNTYSPIPHMCNQQMAKNLDPRYLTILQRLHKLPANTYPNIMYKDSYIHYNTTITTIAHAYSNINNSKKWSTPSPTKNNTWSNQMHPTNK